MKTLGSIMEGEIREQNALLSENSDRYFESLSSSLNDCRPEMILLAARGSSDHAALYARYLIEVFLEIPVSLAAPSVVTYYRKKIRYPKCLAIGISQSGAAPDVAEVLALLRSEGHATLAVTNTPDSHLVQASEFSLLLGVGEERAVAATKTYSASLLALYQATRALGASLPDPKVSLPGPSWNSQARESAAEQLGKVLRSQTWFSLSRGFNFCTAQETALKMMECALLPFKSYSTADFQHGPKALARHGACVLSFGFEMPEVEEQGALVVKCPSNSSPEPLRPIWDVQFGQWLALHAARARSLDPDRPEGLSKVTQTL